MIITSNFRLYSVPARFKMEARDGKSGNWDEFCDWFERGSFPAVFFLFRANEELRDVGRFSPRYRVAQKREREREKREKFSNQPCIFILVSFDQRFQVTSI